MDTYGGAASKSAGFVAPPNTVAQQSPASKTSAPLHQKVSAPPPPPKKAPPSVAPVQSDDDAWKDVVKTLQEGGRADRATHYALTYASLNAKVEELTKKSEAILAAQESLLKAAEEESGKFAKPSQPTREQLDMSWALNLTKAITGQVTEKLKSKTSQTAEQIVREAQQQVSRTVDAKRQAESDAAQTSAMQADAAKRAKAVPMTPQSMGGDLYQKGAQQGMTGVQASPQPGAFAQQTPSSQYSAQNSKAPPPPSYNTNPHMNQNLAAAQDNGYAKGQFVPPPQNIMIQPQFQQPPLAPYPRPMQQQNTYPSQQQQQPQQSTGYYGVLGKGY